VIHDDYSELLINGLFERVIEIVKVCDMFDVSFSSNGFQFKSLNVNVAVLTMWEYMRAFYELFTS